MKTTPEQKPTSPQDEIAKTAYQIWQKEGCQNGRDKEYWLKAEQTVEDKKSPPKKHKDPQTGEIFDLMFEKDVPYATCMARVTGIILIVTSGAWLFLLFDVWSGTNFIQWVARNSGFDAQRCLNSTAFRLVAYSFIGGGIGGVINGFRSLILWHCDYGAFGVRYVWKHVIYPIQGALLGLIVYALVRSGVVLLDGGTKSVEADSTQALAYFGIGALSGYGAQAVFRWLDDKVSNLFKFSKG